MTGVQTCALPIYIATNEKLEAEKQGQLIDNVLTAASRLDDDTVLKCLCDILELDYEEVKEKVEQQEIKNVDFNSLSEQLMNDPKGVNNE